MLDDDTASLVIEKQLSLGLSNCISNSRGQPSSFSDAASRVAASQSKSAIGGFTFDSSLFEDKRTPEQTRANNSSSNGNPNITSIASNGHLIEIVQSNSEMKAANAMLAMAKVAAANNAASNNSSNGAHQSLTQHQSPSGGTGRLILDTTDNGSDTASDEEMEAHIAAAAAAEQMNKSQQQASTMIMNHQQPRGGTSGSNVMSAPTVGMTAAASSNDDDDDDDNDKPLNLSATSTVSHSSTATSSATTSGTSSSTSTTTTSRVYQASNQQIIDIYIDKFLNTGMVCNSNGYANQANAPRQKGMTQKWFLIFKSNLFYFIRIFRPADYTEATAFSGSCRCYSCYGCICRILSNYYCKREQWLSCNESDDQ